MTALAASQGADQHGDSAALTDGYWAAFLDADGIALVGALPAVARGLTALGRYVLV